jgi:hypothetical protein
VDLDFIWQEDLKAREKYLKNKRKKKRKEVRGMLATKAEIYGDGANLWVLTNHLKKYFSLLN